MSGALFRAPAIAVISGVRDDWVAELLCASPVHVDVFDSAWELRRALLGEAACTHDVVIGTVVDPSAPNLAAALAQDGKARSITLVIDDASAKTVASDCKADERMQPVGATHRLRDVCVVGKTELLRALSFARKDATESDRAQKRTIGELSEDFSSETFSEVSNDSPGVFDERARVSHDRAPQSASGNIPRGPAFLEPVASPSLSSIQNSLSLDPAPQLQDFSSPLGSNSLWALSFSAPSLGPFEASGASWPMTGLGAWTPDLDEPSFDEPSSWAQTSEPQDQNGYRWQEAANTRPSFGGASASSAEASRRASQNICSERFNGFLSPVGASGGSVESFASARSLSGVEPVTAMTAQTPHPFATGALEPYASTSFLMPEGQESEAPRLVLVSGRGGVGKSAVSALMAATAAAWGLTVALVDLDLGFGNLFGYFGLDGPADLTRLSAARSFEELSNYGRQANERVTLFGPCEKPEYAETVTPLVTSLLQALSCSFDLVIVDGGTSWGDGVAQAVQAADRLFVCSDERSGSIGTLARVGSLAVRLGVERTRICRLVNRCDPRHKDEGFLARCAEGFQTPQAFEIFEGGVEVAEILSVGHVSDLVDSRNPFAESIAASLAAVLSELGILPDDTRAVKALDGKRRGKQAEREELRWAS